MANGRYIITVRACGKGQKIMARHVYNDYEEAMDMLDYIEENAHKLYVEKVIVDFKDSDPFRG